MTKNKAADHTTCDLCVVTWSFGTVFNIQSPDLCNDTYKQLQFSPERFCQLVRWMAVCFSCF